MSDDAASEQGLEAVQNAKGASEWGAARGSAQEEERGPDRDLDTQGGDEFLRTARDLEQALEDNKVDFELSDGQRSRPSVLRLIDQLRPVVEEWARNVGFTQAPRPVSTSRTEWGFDEYSAWLSELIGYCSALGARPGSVLGLVNGLLLADTVSQLEAGRYAEAVLTEARALETAFYQWEELGAFYGSDLISKAIRPGGPVHLRFSGAQHHEESYLTGMRLLCLGVMKAFRNPLSHGDQPPLTGQDAAAQTIMIAELRRHVVDAYRARPA